MNIRKTLAATAVAVAFAMPAAIVAQEGAATTGRTERHAKAGKRGHGFRHGFAMGRAAAALNLTDQQKEFGKQLFADTRKQSEPVRTELRQTREQLREAVKANNTAEIDRITQRQGVLTGQLSGLHSKAMATFHAQLTPEQKVKADELRAKFKDRASRSRNHQK